MIKNVVGCLVLCFGVSKASGSSIFSAAPSGAARPGPLMILSQDISRLMSQDHCARATHDRLVKLGREHRAEMIVIEELKVLETGRRYEVKLEGRKAFVATTKATKKSCLVAQIPKAKTIF